MKNKVKNTAFTAMFTALTCVAAQIAITLPFSPVSFTFSIFAVFLAGAFLSPVYAVCSQLAYLALGAVGLPVFANFRGGLSALTGATGGFLLAYPIMTLVVSVFAQKLNKNNRFFPVFAGMLLSVAVCHSFGAAGYAFVTEINVSAALPLVSFPFIPFDAVKALLAATFYFALSKRMKNIKM